jgi:dTDP-4-dehydrorhamnose reductase
MLLITGGDGQLAKAISKKLLGSKIDFQCVGKQELDITNYSNLDLIVKETRPKIIVNCAAWTDVEGCETNSSAAFLINSDAVSNLASKCADEGIKLIHISSDYVFSGEKDLPWKTNDPTFPATIYGESKNRAEKYIIQCKDLDFLIVRTSWIYSQWGVNFPKKIIKSILSGRREFKVVSDQVGQPTNANDIATTIVNLVEKKVSKRIFHASNSGSTNWYEFAKLISSKFEEINIEIEPILTTMLNNPLARPKYSVLDCSELVEVGLNLLPDWSDSFSMEFENIRNQSEKELHAKQPI